MRSIFNWLVGGWRLFLRAPARLIGLMVLLFAVEVLVQAGIPSLGIPVSKWVMGVLGGVCWLALDQLDTGGRLRLFDAFRRVGRRWPALMLLALISPFVYLLQVAVGRLVLGPGVIDLLVFASPDAGVAASAWEMGLIFSAGIPFSTLLMFAPPLLLIEGMSAGRSLVASVRLVLRHAVPMGLLALLTMTLVFMAPATFLLSVLLTGPWLLCVGLVAFRGIARPSGEAVWR
jgi:hypothetical protein